jgi:hypothetical protein
MTTEPIRPGPPVVFVVITNSVGHRIGVRAQHPEGVVCDFRGRDQCTCGRPLKSAYQSSRSGSGEAERLAPPARQP